MSGEADKLIAMWETCPDCIKTKGGIVPCAAHNSPPVAESLERVNTWIDEARKVLRKRGT